MIDTFGPFLHMIAALLGYYYSFISKIIMCYKYQHLILEC